MTLTITVLTPAEVTTSKLAAKDLADAAAAQAYIGPARN